MAKPLIKWPGGKSSELDQILPLIPEHDRYIEPFFGGGAVYFALEPEKAVINDISEDLMNFYVGVREQDQKTKEYLEDFRDSFAAIQYIAELQYDKIYDHYSSYMKGELKEETFAAFIIDIVGECFDRIMSNYKTDIVRDPLNFRSQLERCLAEKVIRTAKAEKKQPINDRDRMDCFITGFTSGYYMYFRDVYNDIRLNRGPLYSMAYKNAVFYFVREYCYGSMFRYNRLGEFNIPYGGISYNRKNLQNKIDNIFGPDIQKLFAGTLVYCMDFEKLMGSLKLKKTDFIFLDPPYDTDFSDYEGREFARKDHERLAILLSETEAKFLLVIKNTEFIYSLYKDNFYVSTFDNKYSYNVKSRNDRKAEHLIITNYKLEMED